MKVYRAKRTAEGVKAWIEDGGAIRPLPHVVYHSRAGFEMGHGGSGPADLALSILADYFRVEPRDAAVFRIWEPSEAADAAWRLHLGFKWRFVAGARQQLRVDEDEIDRFVQEERGVGARWSKPPPPAL